MVADLPVLATVSTLAFLGALLVVGSLSNPGGGARSSALSCAAIFCKRWYRFNLPSLCEDCQSDAEAKKQSTAQQQAEIYLSRIPGIAECQIVISGR